MTIGFQGDAVLTELSRAEIARRALPDVWYGEFYKDLICVSAIAGTLIIPKGFLTDGASIPRAFWNLPGFSPTAPECFYPAFAHDFLYSIHGQLAPGVSITREQCDGVLREQILALGTSEWRANVIWRAVRLFGGIPWNRITPVQKIVNTPVAPFAYVRKPPRKK